MTPSRASAPVATPGVKMLYLIRRKPTTSREELVAHWFANHMPLVIAAQQRWAAEGKLHARRYIATLFQAAPDGSQPWDGVAQLWWDRALPKPAVPHGTAPTDTFQQKAEPYVPWATTEYVIVDDEGRLSNAPLTLNAPYPSTRSGFSKATFLVKTLPGTDFARFFEHWLGVHVPNVEATLRTAGGFRYVMSLSTEPHTEPYAGMVELYFPDAAAQQRFFATLQPDGTERWLDTAGTLLLQSDTELIGLP